MHHEIYLNTITKQLYLFLNKDIAVNGQMCTENYVSMSKILCNWYK